MTLIASFYAALWKTYSTFLYSIVSAVECNYKDALVLQQEVQLAEIRGDDGPLSREGGRVQERTGGRWTCLVEIGDEQEGEV